MPAVLDVVRVVTYFVAEDVAGERSSCRGAAACGIGPVEGERVSAR